MLIGVSLTTCPRSLIPGIPKGKTGPSLLTPYMDVELSIIYSMWTHLQMLLSVHQMKAFAQETNNPRKMAAITARCVTNALPSSTGRETASHKVYQIKPTAFKLPNTLSHDSISTQHKATRPFQPLLFPHAGPSLTTWRPKNSSLLLLTIRVCVLRSCVSSMYTKIQHSKLDALFLSF